MASTPTNTGTADYTRRLTKLEQSWLHRLVPVQLPYRWNLRRWDLGFVLDVGCGIGRNLRNLDGNGVGVDHNRTSVEQARQSGLNAYVTSDFFGTQFARPGRFDSLLVAHVLEHVSNEDQVQLLGTFLPYVKPGGKVVLITPQEAGYASDASHINFTDTDRLIQLIHGQSCRLQSAYSFPFPRSAGRYFKHNEFVAVGIRP